MNKNKITFSKIVECEDKDILHFIEVNNPKGFTFEKSEKIDELNKEEKAYLTEILRSRFDVTELEYFFKDTAKMLLTICKKLNIDDDNMINYFKTFFKE